VTSDRPEDPGDPAASLFGHFPGWEIWRRPDGVICAWLVGTSPPLLLRDTDVGRLAQAIEAHKSAGGGDR
jgi:hypothetical protein